MPPEPAPAHCRCRAACAEQQTGGIAIQIVDGPADVAKGTAAIGHQRARAFVEVVGELADRLYRLKQFTTILAAGDGIEAEHQVVRLGHDTIGFAHDLTELLYHVIDFARVARKRSGEGLDVLQRVLHCGLVFGNDAIDVLQCRADRTR